MIQPELLFVSNLEEMHDRRWFMRIGRQPVATMPRAARRVEKSVARAVEKSFDQDLMRERDIEESLTAETDAKLGPPPVTPPTLP
jgi:hypothetical protein